MRGKKIAEGDLDAILALQIQIARAGEWERLSWWRVDATDIDGGGDFFIRLVGSASGLCGVEAAMAGARAFELSVIEEAGVRQEIVSLFNPDFSLKIQLQERWTRFKNHPDDIPDAIRASLDHELAFSQSEILVVELGTHQRLTNLCLALLGAELSIDYIYPMMTRPHGSPTIAVKCDDPVLAGQILVRKGFSIISEDQLRDDAGGDPYVA